MHILFVHQNYPGQFGHIARYLAARKGYRCSFASLLPPGQDRGVKRIQYKPIGGATRANHYCSRTFENTVAHAHGVHQACRAQLDSPPDLIVGHSGFGSTLFLSELYDCPIINYFEYFYRSKDSDLDFRPEFPPAPMDVLRSKCRNAMILLDLENCRAGYSPTPYQRSLFPAEFQDKIEVIFDGVETDVWKRTEGGIREINGRRIAPGTRIITYVSRGFESMRGFDIFMKVAKRIYQERSDVLFVVVGEDKIAYGGDLKHIEGKSFLQHVLKQDDYDMSKFLFTGRLPAEHLARVLSIGDLHIYLTVPFVLSWSLFNALSCGATVLASDTAPVRDLIRHEENGLLAGFYDVDGLVAQALRVLKDPGQFRPLGQVGSMLIRDRHSVETSLPKMLALYERAAGRQVEPPAPERAVPRPHLALVN